MVHNVAVDQKSFLAPNQSMLFQVSLSNQLQLAYQFLRPVNTPLQLSICLKINLQASPADTEVLLCLDEELRDI